MDRLEELVNNAWQVPTTKSVVVSQERFMDLVDQVRLAIPAEIRHAQRVQQDRERILAQAKEEARRITEQAAEEASKLADEQPLTQQARARSEQIIAKAYEEAAFMRRESDAYALDTLKNLQTQLQAIEKQVQNGIELLEISLHTDAPDDDT